MDKNGHLLVMDSSHHRILRLIDGRLHLVAGTGEAGYSGDGGDAKLARLDSHQAVACDAQRRVVINDEHNKCVRRIDLDGTILTILGRGYPTDSPADLEDPEHVVAHIDGSILVTDSDAVRVWRLAPDGSVTLLAGKPLD